MADRAKLRQLDFGAAPPSRRSKRVYREIDNRILRLNDTLSRGEKTPLQFLDAVANLIKLGLLENASAGTREQMEENDSTRVFDKPMPVITCITPTYYRGLLENASAGTREQMEENDSTRVFDKPMPVIYAITPTYYRGVQKAELTRLSQTFLHLPSFHWIVIEDSSLKTKLVTNVLSQSGVIYTHLNFLTERRDSKRLKTKGVSQRNVGLSWLRKPRILKYSLVLCILLMMTIRMIWKIFAQMRETKQVSVWPVGFAGGLRFERPIVKNGKVTGWFAHWEPDRPFAIDMAGFAVNLQLFYKHPELKFSNNTLPGFLESTFVSDTKVSLDDLEPLADNCTKVLVWHTRTESPDLTGERQKKRKLGHGSDPNVEV
ncbi:LOW QUALITY PROTEIN: galactosylgalactosylxylosylprotein 3-beta-glucuronosyltransferase 2-like [Haliotis rubra]|uniref:LOW QUALITY PROTEIN: galactosylgalactosylxylosylprotein 3-beta-glucuronosyltransferase 2-like n=1 Tax=Haliotis rubra TaxID=36100 RepID=UPI001EE634AC|nr:LOW QUALITY PROTEIN: galactosylgalactosylxylosylprotein 3-beta-glucuronosyltransferase 2-like [Haliotis rubra]